MFENFPHPQKTDYYMTFLLAVTTGHFNLRLTTSIFSFVLLALIDIESMCRNSSWLKLVSHSLGMVELILRQEVGTRQYECSAAG